MQFFIFAALISVAVASSVYNTAPSYAAPAYKAPAYSAPAYSAPAYSSPSYETQYAAQPYSFDWAVKEAGSYNDYSHSADLDYSHSESSDGKVTTGTYRVVLPDGRTQIVNYRADSYGYVADVKYEGDAKYPEYKAASYNAPTYSAPRAYASPAVYKAPAAPVYAAPSY